MLVLKCPMCGGNLEAGENLARITCKFCGSNILLKGKKERPNGITPSGVDVASMLHNGYVLLAEGEYGRAKKCFKEVLHAQADNSGAHLGLFLCGIACTDPHKLEDTLEKLYRDAAGSTKTLEAKHREITGNTSLQKAIKYSGEERLEALPAWLEALCEELPPGGPLQRAGRSAGPV